MNTAKIGRSLEETRRFFSNLSEREFLNCMSVMMEEMTNRGLMSMEDTERLLAESPEAQRQRAAFEKKLPEDMRADGARDI